MQRDNTRELLRRNGREEEMENDLLELTECECGMNVYDPSKCKCRDTRKDIFFLHNFIMI